MKKKYESWLHWIARKIQEGTAKEYHHGTKAKIERTLKILKNQE